MSENTLPTGKRGQILALALVFLVIGLAAIVLEPLWLEFADQQAELEQLQDRVARYQRLSRTLPGLEARVRAAEQAQNTEWLIDASSAALAAAQLQRQLRTLTLKHGGKLLSTLAGKVKKDGAFQQIPINARVQIDTVGLQKLLYELETGQPLIVIEHITIVGQVSRRDESLMLDVVIDFFGLTPKEAPSDASAT